MVKILSLVAAAIILTCCTKQGGGNSNSSWGDRIRSNVEYAGIAFVSPHIGRTNVLEVDGKRFVNVRGVNNFYLTLPKSTNSILFVTEQNDGSATYNVYDMVTRQMVVAAHIEESLFGQAIGTAQNARREDSIEETNGILWLNTKFKSDTGDNTVVRDQLNLIEKKVQFRIVTFLDAGGHKTKEYKTDF